jgi:signal transduction histidine kinase
MNLRPWFRPPRRVFAAFLAMLALLAAGFVWLGWTVTSQIERQRIEDRLSLVADHVTIAVKSALDNADRRLEQFVRDIDAGRPDAGARQMRPGETAVVLDGAGVRASPAERLAYYPVVAAEASAFDALVVSAHDLLRQAAAMRVAGQHSAALAVYDRLASARTTLLDVPAEIVARHARCQLLEELGRASELADEARALAAAVRRHPSRLTVGRFEYYAAEIRRWLAADRSSETLREFDRAEALASLVAVAWRDWPRAAGDGAQVRSVRHGDESYTVLTRDARDRMAMFIGDAEFLASAVDEGLRTAPDGAAVDVALVIDGTVSAGRMPGTDRTPLVRLPEQTTLPWSIYVAPGGGWRAEPVARDRRLLLLTGVALVALCAVAGGIFAARAVHRELEAARLQSEFVAAVSHEFRTPLAAVSQIAEMLADGRVAGDADREEFYRRLLRESGRLRRLVEDLLDFRRMEAGAHEYRREHIEVAPLLRHLVDDMATDDTARARIALTVAEPLPAIHADGEAIARAVRNLVDNALKYSAPAAPVEVTAAAAGDAVAISVRDHGAGIAPHLRRVIFDKFVRAPGSAAIPGSGLGLAMVRHIAAAHGGSVELASEPGHGSTFTLRLPAA